MVTIYSKILNYVCEPGVPQEAAEYFAKLSD